MFGFLQQPYVFALALALVTSVLAFLYAKTTDKDGSANRTFFKTLAAGTLAGVVLTYVSRMSRGEQMATEPFDMPGNNLGGGMGGMAQQGGI